MLRQNLKVKKKEKNMYIHICNSSLPINHKIITKQFSLEDESAKSLSKYNEQNEWRLLGIAMAIVSEKSN